MPIAHHGAASSVVISGTPIRRPKGQYPEGDTIVYEPTKRMDFELAIGLLTGGEGRTTGEPISINEAEEQIFGAVLLNDWSARDIQAWEDPLGPFCGKSFGTTISPWIITPQALEPFKTRHALQNPPPIQQLDDPEHVSWNVKLQLNIQPEGTSKATEVVRSNLLNQYWTIRQQIAYLT